MNRMHRRQAVKQLSVLAAGLSIVGEASSAATTNARTGLGIVMYDCQFRRTLLKKQDDSVDLFEPFRFLRHVHSLGAGGVHLGLGAMTSREAGEFRDEAERYSMFVDAIVSPPQDASDLSRFEAEIKVASEVGVQSARTVIIPGRRYERFSSFEDFQDFERRGRQLVELATPIVEKYQVPLAIENHKDQRIEDRVRLYEHIDSEYVGACVDTGNSFALLDDVYGSIEALAALCVLRSL